MSSTCASPGDVAERDGPQGWPLARYAALQAFFAWGIGFYGPPVFLAELTRSQGWSVTSVSSAITLHFLIAAALVFWLPECHRRFGLARVTLLGIGAAAAGVLGWSLAPSPLWLHAAAPLSACGWALLSGASLNAIVAPWFDRQRPRAIALAFNGATVGGLVFAPLWTLLFATVGFTNAALIVGGTMLALLAPLAARRLALVPPPAPADASPRTPRARLISSRAFLLLWLPFALALFAQIGLLTHLVARLAPTLSASGAAWCITAMASAAIGGRWLLARLVGEHDRRLAAALNFAVQALGTLLLIGATQAPLLVLGCLLFGLGFGNLTSLPPLIAQQRFARSDVATVVALLTSFNTALFALAPLLFGWLRDLTFSYTASFSLALAAQLLAAMVMLLARRL